MVKIMGVDFSGAQDEKKSDTWLAQGRLEGNAFNLETCHPIIRADLTAKLKSLKGPAVVGMDFPFSVPVEFARCWQPAAWTMPDLWEQAAKTSPVEFRKRVNCFLNCLNCDIAQNARALCRCRKEPRRPEDPPHSFSPFHQKGTDMVPMTHRGMKMLHSIWDAKSPNKPLWIPPLPKCQPRAKSHIVLLEVMPGATLDSLGIKRTGAKGGGAAELREKILTELRSKANEWGIEVRFSRKSDLYQTCRANDDALDAVVAAITAAMWHIEPQQFHRPEDIAGVDWETVMLEGWLYAPER